MILLTGADGFIGTHIMAALQGSDLGDVHTLSRRGEIQCDLERDVPTLPHRYDAVIHCAGTADPARAEALNHHGTERLLQALETAPPRHFTLISTVHVYGSNPGEDVAEDCFLRPDTEYARSKIRAEKLCEQWCRDHDVELTILRPALTAGQGMHGRLATMAAAIARGRYVHIRGNGATRSLVLATDLARAVVGTLHTPGVFNVTDGRARTVIELGDAMATNLARDKRILHAPAFWMRLASAPFPSLRAKVATLTTSCTYSNARLCAALPDWHPYDTVEVIARRDPDYPYQQPLDDGHPE